MTPTSPTAETVRFPVAGMTCGSCVNRIVRAVGRVEGVTKVRVDLRMETATVRRGPALVSNAALAAAGGAARAAAAGAAAEVNAPGGGRSFLDRILRRS